MSENEMVKVEFDSLPDWLKELWETKAAIARKAEAAFNELETENRKLREDAAQVFINELVVNGGGMDASLTCQPFTRVIAQWAVESFKAASDSKWTPNFLTLDFGLAGEEHYTMTITRSSGNSPEKMAGAYRKALEKIRGQLIDGMNRHCWDEAYRIAADALEGKV